MILYLDLYFLINFLMDLLLLDLTKHYLKLSGSHGRLAAAAAVGAIGACILEVLSCVPGTFWISEITPFRVVIGLIGAGVITGIAFGADSFRQWLRRTAVLCFAGMTLAGGMELLMAGDPQRLPYWMAGLTILLFARWIWSELVWQIREKGRYCLVRLEYRGRSVEIRAICDTGNLLYEPYHRKPVHVVTAEPIRQICQTVDRVIYIPYRSVGEEQGILPGIQIDQMIVMRDGKPTKRLEKPWIAISPTPLTARHQYEMLLHLDEF